MQRIVTALATAAILAAFGSGGAEANVYDFTYSGGGYIASGVFTTGDAGSPYTVTEITGTADGSAITGLSAYAAADQLLYYPGPVFVDQPGISFETAAGIMYNISSFPTGTANSIAVSTLDPGGGGCCMIGVEMSVVQVPEPATWVMMALGFAGLGFASYRARIRERLA